MEERGLPPGWSWATLQDIGTIISGGTPKTSDPANFDGDVPWITPADLARYTTKTISRGRRNLSRKGLETSSARIIPKRSVLFSSRAPIGYVAIASNDLTTNQGFKSVDVNSQFDEGFLYFYLKSAKELAERNASGTTFKEISGSRFAQLPIPVAPLNEQRRIVEKIETLFARLDKGEEALRDVQKLLARYRQSVLKAAVTGELTADWRAKNAHRLEHGRDLLARILKTRRETWQGRGKYKEPTAPDTTDLPELPEGWVWASLVQLTNIKGGITVDKKREARDPVTIPYLRVANVQNGFLDLQHMKEITVEREKAEQCLLLPGDILLNEGGDRDKLGRGWVWSGEIDQCIHQNHVFRARPIINELSSRFISYYTNSFGQPFFMLKGKQSVNLASISLTAISGLPIPLPPIEEQTEIVLSLEQRLSEMEVLAGACQTELTRSIALRQSILKDAFAGRLVSQDPTDEPAAALLARIKETRAAAPRKTRKSKARI